MHALGLHELDAGKHGALRFTHAAALRAGDQQHGCANVGGDIAVQIVFKSRVLPHEVGAFAEDEVILRFKLFESDENPVHELVGFAGVDQVQSIFEGTGIGFLIGHIQMKCLQQQLDVMIGAGRIRTVDDRPEEGGTPHPP